MVLWKIFGPKRVEVTGEWRRVQRDKLYDLSSTPDNIPMIKSKTMRWAAHIARVAERRMHAWFWWVNLREMDYLKNIGVDRMIIFKCLFKKYGGHLE
jgi:hypothetical protein